MSESESRDELQEKRDLVGKRLQEREDERLKQASKRREEADKFASQTESTDHYMETVNARAKSIREGIADAKNLTKEKLPSYFDDLSNELGGLQKFVTESTMFISAYDLGQSQGLLKEIQVEISSCRDALLPTKKFAFKNRKKQTVAKPTDSAGDTSPVKVTPQSYDVSANEYRISDICGKTTDISSGLIRGKDVILSKVSDCTVKITGVPSAMHLTDVVNSTVICGPCARSIFIERCTGCTFVLACQQLRIHEATESVFHIHVTSKAIIEDSKGLKFGPYKLSYTDLDTHYSESGLSREVNNWDDVDDFNWLVKDKQSPNWSALSSDSHQSFTMISGTKEDGND